MWILSKKAENCKNIVLTVKQYTDLPENSKSGRTGDRISQRYSGSNCGTVSVKRSYRADIRPLADENDIIGLRERVCVACYTRRISGVNPVTLVRLWRKLLPGLEDDLKGLPNEETSRPAVMARRFLFTAVRRSWRVPRQH
jgi:hypothetical protein